MTHHLITAVLLALLAPLASAESPDISEVGVDTKQDRRRFSNTQRWDPDLLALTRAKPRHLPADWSKQIRIPAPPPNSSPRTRKIAGFHYPSDTAAGRLDARQFIDGCD